MPNSRQRASTASAETRALLPEVPRRSGTDPTSYLYDFTEPLPPLPPNRRQPKALRTAVLVAEPFDVAIDWQNYSFPQGSSQNISPFPFSAGGQGPLAPVHTDRAIPCGLRAPPIHFGSLLQGTPTNRILVLNTAHEKKPCGDWDGGILTQEEEFARRSNLSQALSSTDPRSPTVQTYYPLPQTGAVYSPNIVIFRDGFRKSYTIWPDEAWTTVSVVSAAPVRRPKTDDSCMRYSFEEEKNLQRCKMRSILRVAALNGHINLVLGGFGSSGPEASSGVYKNPVEDMCELWKELLGSAEFEGWFANIVFALGGNGGNWAKELDTHCIKKFEEFFE